MGRVIANDPNAIYTWVDLTEHYSIRLYGTLAGPNGIIGHYFRSPVRETRDAIQLKHLSR